MAEKRGDIDQLIDLMAKLPGLGPRSARRAVLHLLRRRAALMLPLAQSMAALAENVQDCATCGNLGASDTCDICANPERDPRLICVVEDLSDLWALERAGLFKGRYHVLGGVLSALDGIGPEELRIPQLLHRASDASEVILALNATIEGQATAHYIADSLTQAGVPVTTLAQGVPVGGELDYLDEGTISAALNARRKL